MSYVDGFLIAVPKKNIQAYKKIASAAKKVWREHGALDYVEAVGEDLVIKGCGSFASLLKLKKDETAVFAYIVYKSRAHRDKVNAKVMKDPRMNEMMAGKEMPFEMTRMFYGGFDVLVK